MQRPCREARIQHHTEKVERALEEAPHTIFGLAELSSTMIDGYFTHAKAVPMEQDRDESMQLAI